MTFKRLNDLKLVEEYCNKPYNKECPKCDCYNDEFQCRYWKQVWEKSNGEQVLRIGNNWYEEAKMEVKVIYEGNGISISEDGIVHNPHNKPVTDIIYRMAKEINKLKANVMTECPVCGEQFLNPVGCQLYDQLKDKQDIINKATTLIRELKEVVDG